MMFCTSLSTSACVVGSMSFRLCTKLIMACASPFQAGALRPASSCFLKNWSRISETEDTPTSDEPLICVASPRLWEKLDVRARSTRQLDAHMFMAMVFNRWGVGRGSVDRTVRTIDFVWARRQAQDESRTK